MAIMVVVIVFLTAFSYFTYFSPPLKADWKSNIGYQDVGISGGVALGDNSYFLLSVVSAGSPPNWYKITALNSSTGLEQWVLNINLTEQANLSWTTYPSSSNETYGNLPQIHYFNHSLYLAAYYLNYSIETGNQSNKIYLQGERARSISAIIARINPSNGTVQSIRTISLSSTITLNETLPVTMEWNKGVVYLGYQTEIGNLLTTDITATNITTSQILWSRNLSIHYLGPIVPMSQFYLSQEYVAVLTATNGSGTLHSLSQLSGDTLFNYNLSNVVDIVGTIKNSFVFTSLSLGILQLNVADLSALGIANFSTEVRVPVNFIPNLHVTACYGDILISYNSTVYDFSTHGHLLWKKNLPYLGRKGYESGFLEIGNKNLLYWAEVGVHFVTNGGINYRVTYNYFAALNSEDGHIVWQRSYSPAPSFFFNLKGSPISIIAAYNDRLIYQMPSPEGSVVMTTYLQY